MPSGGFEPAIPAIERPQTYVLDRTATGIAYHKKYRKGHVQLSRSLSLLSEFLLKKVHYRAYLLENEIRLAVFSVEEPGSSFSIVTVTTVRPKFDCRQVHRKAAGA